MKETLKILALLGGGYLLYRSMTSASADVVAAPATTAAAAAAPNGTAIADMLNAAAVAQGFREMLNADQWGWLYAQVRGQAAPDPNRYLAGRPRSYQFTAEQWAGEALTPVGMSGLTSRAWGI